MMISENEPGHGHSVAAWTAVVTAILGTTILTLGLLLLNNSLLISGGVVTLLSIVIGPILAKLGYGVSGKTKSS
ncbi:MAG: HGxxPAAW family protein [Rhodoluna sp.]